MQFYCCAVLYVQISSVLMLKLWKVTHYLFSICCLIKHLLKLHRWANKESGVEITQLKWVSDESELDHTSIELTEWNEDVTENTSRSIKWLNVISMWSVQNLNTDLKCYFQSAQPGCMLTPGLPTSNLTFTPPCWLGCCCTCSWIVRTLGCPPAWPAARAWVRAASWLPWSTSLPLGSWPRTSLAGACVGCCWPPGATCCWAVMAWPAGAAEPDWDGCWRTRVMRFASPP